MRFVGVSEEEIYLEKRKKSTKMKKFVEEFLESGYKLARVYNDGEYFNNNDVRRALQSVIELNNFPCRVFMTGGEVYLERKY